MEANIMPQPKQEDEEVQILIPSILTGIRQSSL